MTTVLFACVHNAGRSQMAAALFNRIADPAKARDELGWTAERDVAQMCADVWRYQTTAK